MVYLPKETHVKSTSEVINIFEKPNAEEGINEEKPVDVPESEMDTV